MMDSIDRGMRIEGLLPGRLQVPRRARCIQQKLDADRFRNRQAPHVIMDHVSVFAIAVNEENAAGGRVVTAPTHGSAGVVPAALRSYRAFCPETDRQGMWTFLRTSSPLGALTNSTSSLHVPQPGGPGCGVDVRA